MTPNDLSERARPAPVVDTGLLVVDQCGTTLTPLLSCLTGAFARLAPGGSLLLCAATEIYNVEANDARPRIGSSPLAALLGRCGFDPAVEPGALGATPAAEAAGGCKDLIYRRAQQAPRWRLTHLTENEFGAFSLLFETVFGHAMTPALWRWKYAGGRGCSVAAWRGDRLVAHYGGSLREVLAFGRPVQALQVCDAMVDPRERAIMTKTGAMFQVTASFLEIYQGLAGIPLAFGFPNLRAMRLGERLGLYADVGALRELRWSALGKGPRLTTRLRDLNPDSAVDRRSVEQLWAEMAQDLKDGLIGVRDWNYLRHRYIEHPERRYKLVLVRSRFTGAALGLLVLRLDEKDVVLIDLVAPMRRIPLLLVQARRLTGLWGRPSLYGWITRQNVSVFTPSDPQIRDIDVSIPTNAWVSQPFDPAQLCDRWWLTLGDTDFS